MFVMIILKPMRFPRAKKFHILLTIILGAAITAGATLFGCARHPVQPPAQVGADQAAGALIEEGRHLLAAGQAAQAEAALERAIRIQPRNPEPWYAMAQAKLAQGQSQQAVQFSLKAIALLTPSHPLQGPCWELAAEGYRLMGELDKARAAKVKAGAVRY